MKFPSNNLFAIFLFFFACCAGVFSIDINETPSDETKIPSPGQTLEEPSAPIEVHQGNERAVQPSAPLTNGSTETSISAKATAPTKASAAGKVSSAAHPSQSAVYEEQKGETPEYRGYTNPNLQSRTFKHLQEQLEAEEEDNNNNTGGFRSVSAPVAKPPSERPQQPSMRCGGCDMLATGVIVKANGVPYHVACFKCTSCSLNLKQKGFFVVEGKLYCETHAKFHAKPPGPDMVAVPMYR